MGWSDAGGRREAKRSEARQVSMSSESTLMPIPVLYLWKLGFDAPLQISHRHLPSTLAWEIDVYRRLLATSSDVDRNHLGRDAGKYEMCSARVLGSDSMVMLVVILFCECEADSRSLTGYKGPPRPVT